MIVFFVISNKVVWRFNRETFRVSFSETAVLKVLLLEKWTLRGWLYENGNKLSHRTSPEIINCFCLHSIFTGSHQFQINVISAFHNKLWNQFGKLFKRSWFFAFDIWKKRRLYVFNFLFLVTNIYCFFDILLFQWSWYMVTALGIFFMICSSVCEFWKFV